MTNDGADLDAGCYIKAHPRTSSNSHSKLNLIFLNHVASRLGSLFLRIIPQFHRVSNSNTLEVDEQEAHAEKLTA